MGKIQVLIVDDHQLSAMGAQAMIQQDEGIKVVATVNSASEALEYIDRSKPDVVLLDVIMPGLDGFEALKVIKSKHADVKVIMMTISDEKETIMKTLALGADGLVFKDVIKSDMINAIHKVFDNKPAFSQKMFDLLLPEFIDFAGSKVQEKKFDKSSTPKETNYFKPLSKKSEIKSKLTEREYEILSLVGKGMSTQEISEFLDLSKFTVSTYRKNITAKLGTKNIKEMVAFANIINSDS